MSAIGPGDFVECIRTDPFTSVKTGGAKVGGVYVVEDVGVGFNGQPYLNCRGMVRPAPPHLGWCATAFRPIYRRDESLTTRLMQPLPADVEQVHA